MSEASASYHETIETLSARTRDLHRALVSLQEELEAIDWYRQRADACDDKALRSVLLHNMRDEMEHAGMLVEWLRRNDSDFRSRMETYRFAQGDIVATERQAKHESPEADLVENAPASPAAATPSIPGRITIGSLRKKS